MATSLFIPSATDSQIEEIQTAYEDYLYRTAYKFGGKEVDRVTLLNVHCRIRTKAGKSAVGFGSMPLGNMWSIPASNISYETTLAAMKSLWQKIAQLLQDFREYAHPLDVNRALQPEYLKVAPEISREMSLAEPIPKLCTLVTASPFDAALHDAFGRLHNRSSYAACGREFVRHDLAHYLTPDFRGEYLDHYIMREPAARIRMFHSVGASDPLMVEELKHGIADGLPETLEEWIPYNGLTAFKIKPNGDNLAWDVERVAAIERVAARAEAKRHFSGWIYSLDFNERCPNVQYVLDFERQLQGKATPAFRRVQYIEHRPPAISRPTGRTPC
jgi:hypothetical protein